MKPRCRQNPATGLWYCTRMGITGEGESPMAAFRDMVGLYKKFFDKLRDQRLSLGNRSPRA